MDIASLIGIIFGAFVIVISILLSVSWDFALLLKYIDWPSVMCTFGGSIASTLIGNPMPQLITAFKSVGLIFKTTSYSPSNVINDIIALANIARKEGLLYLEEASQTVDDPLLKKGLLLLVDSVDPEAVRSILETELSFIQERHKEAQSIWEYMGSMGPAWGMIGTLIGLINMLNNLSEPNSLGPNMAVALITTFYGAILANYICIPIANKLKILDAEETLMKEVIIEGVLSIHAGENPRLIEEKLKSFLSPSLRDTVVFNTRDLRHDEGGE